MVVEITKEWRKTVAVLLIIGSASVAPSAIAGGDPNNLKWSTAAPMLEARLGHAMVELLPGPSGLGLNTGAGKVMVIGGFDSAPLAYPTTAIPLASCEIYDPATNTWTPAAPHPVPGGWRWAGVLSNGMVLVAGGSQSLAINLADSHLYDPATNRWIATRPLPIGTNNPHAFMHPVVLANGQVLIAGGEDDDAIKGPALLHSHSSYLFTLNAQRPSQSSWDYTRNKSNRKVSQMPEGRTTSALLLMSDGRVLNVGGLGPSFEGSLAATNTASIYDPNTGVWTSAAPMPPVLGFEEDELITPYPTSPGSRWSPFSASLDDGPVLIAGGNGGLFEVDRKSALLYDPRTNVWQITTPMHFRRGIGSLKGKLPADAGILFAGPGFSDSGQFANLTGEIFHPKTSTWTLVPPVDGPPVDGSVGSWESQSVVLSTGRLQISGGAALVDAFAIRGSWIFGAPPR
jgi:hypothetical protein